MNTRGLHYLRLSLALAALAVLVLSVIVFSRIGEGSLASLESPELTQLRAEVQAAPANAELRQELQREDRRIRTLYFANRKRRAWGGRLLILLLGGSLLAAARHRALNREAREARLPDFARLLRPRGPLPVVVGTLVVALVVGGLMGALGGPVAPLPGLPAPPPPPPAKPQFQDNWACFRGPSGQGHVTGTGYPRKWDFEKGTNILWKSAVGIEGHSSPILWGGKLFVTGGDARRRAVLCFDRSTGNKLWSALVRPPAGVKLEVGGEPLQIYQDTGYAAPTPVTDGERVYAIFATGDLAAVDFTGKVVWVRNLGIPDSAYGYAASLAIHRGRVLVQYDQGNDAALGLSRMLAVEGATGKTLWEKKRPVGGSWSSPAVLQVGGKPMLVTCGNPWVIAYDPFGGKELWRCDTLYGDVAPMAVSAGKVVYVTNDMAVAAAIKADGVGNVTGTHLLWSEENGCSDTASPLTDGKYFLQGRGDGQLTCFAAATGKQAWEEYLDQGIKSSPLLIGDTVYLTDQSGITMLFKLGGEFNVVERNDLGEAVAATPACGDGRLYFRAYKHLYCIGEKK